jgi:hypothetical protein
MVGEIVEGTAVTVAVAKGWSGTIFGVGGLGKIASVGTNVGSGSGIEKSCVVY